MFILFVYDNSVWFILQNKPYTYSKPYILTVYSMHYTL